MESPRVTLTPELKARLAVGHDKLGRPAPKWDFQVYVSTGGLHSTANDLLKYVSANAGLAPSALTPLMRSEEHTSELQSPDHLVCRLLLEKKKHMNQAHLATH